MVLPGLIMDYAMKENAIVYNLRAVAVCLIANWNTHQVETHENQHVSATLSQDQKMNWLPSHVSLPECFSMASAGLVSSVLIYLIGAEQHRNSQI